MAGRGVDGETNRSSGKPFGEVILCWIARQRLKAERRQSCLYSLSLSMQRQQYTMCWLAFRIPFATNTTSSCLLLMTHPPMTPSSAFAPGCWRRVFRFRSILLFNPQNQGYGGNQKIGYFYAIKKGFDFVALVHGDGQYAPECLPDLVRPLARGEADAVFGSRMKSPGAARAGGMPLYKFVGNKILTRFENWALPRLGADRISFRLPRLLGGGARAGAIRAEHQ